MKTCSNCGKTLSPSATFCPFCGTRFAADAGRSAPPPSSRSGAPQPQRVRPAVAPAPRSQDPLARPEPRRPTTEHHEDPPHEDEDTMEAGAKTTVQPMTPEMLRQLEALRTGGPAPEPAPQPAPRAVAPAPMPSAPVTSPVPTRDEDVETAEELDDPSGATRMLDLTQGPDLGTADTLGAETGPRAADVNNEAATRMIDLNDQPPLGHAQAPAAASRPEPTPQKVASAEPVVRAQPQAAARPVAGHVGTQPPPEEAELPDLPRMAVDPQDAIIGPPGTKPPEQMAYALRHLKAVGIARLGEHTITRRETFLDERKRTTLEQIGLSAWRGGIRRPDFEDAVAALDKLRDRHAELQAALRDQEGAVAQEKEAIRAELRAAQQGLAESDRSLSTLVANLRAAEAELGTAQRELKTHQTARAAAEKELAAIKGGKGDAARTPVLEAEVARHAAAAQPLLDTVRTLQQKRASVAEAEHAVREKVTPARQKESQIRARLAVKDREAAERTKATREQLTGVERDMAGPARRIGEHLNQRRAEFPDYVDRFRIVDACAAVSAHDRAVKKQLHDARAALDDAAAKKGWILIGAIAGGVLVLLIVLSLIF